MDVGLLEQLVKLMAANDLNTVDVRDGDKRVILKRGPRRSRVRLRTRRRSDARPAIAGVAAAGGRTVAGDARRARSPTNRRPRRDQEPDGRHVLLLAQARRAKRSSTSAATSTRRPTSASSRR